MDEEKVYYTIILRHDTSTNWMMNNPILALSEYGVEDDTHRVKRGDGQSNWADLPYEHFGLEYLVTFEGLLGEVNDNLALKEAFNEKVDKNIFTENANGLIENITLTTEDGAIGKITRLTKDVTTGAARASYLIIKSDDNSLQGVYTVNDEGIRVLNVRAYSHINDYEAGKIYHINELCYYDNRLYRAVDEEFIAESTFTKSHWVLLASLHSSDIKYNHLTSGLESDTVKTAIDELADLDSEKVKKTSRENKVYGTNEFGEQFLYNKDDLRKVDMVNHKQADLNKNVQIDASDINYTDSDPSKGTVRQTLDSKVDKIVAGQGAKIVRDVQFEYNESNGAISLIEDKFSLEDGSSTTERRDINVVSEQELAGEVQTLNNRITNEVETLNNRVDTEVQTLNNRIDTEVETLNDRVDTEVENLNTTITNEVNTLNNRVDTEVQTLNTTITNKETAIYNKIEAEHDEINARVDQEVSDLNDTIATEQARVNSEISRLDTEDVRLDAKINDLTDTVAANKTDIETKLNEAKVDYNNKITNAVNTLNDTISDEVNTLNDRIDNEVETLNDTIITKETAIYNRITSEHNNINDRVDQEVQTLNATINTKETNLYTKIAEEKEALTNIINTKDTAMDTKKIDKDIATGLVSEIIADTQSNEPTLKVTTKNTTTKTATVSHLHFKAQGQIQTKFQDADHIVIDSTNIDDKNAQQDTRLTNAEERITANETNITTLQAHDTVHDNTLALHAQQIAGNTHDIQDLQVDVTEAQTDIARLQTQNASQEAHLTTHDQDIQDINDAIIATNQNVSRNTTSITALQNNKANKTFANLTNNKVVGTLNTQELQNNEIIKLGIKSIDPSTETASDSILKVISSDNTIIATRDQDTGVIDLKANLDTDVNYFVTTEILNTTIPSENIIPLNTLTPTDKVNVEVHDIISDPEGTWARVESINDTLQTCVAVTFKKHAQAVWGTIKGDINDQSDLQGQFSQLETDLEADITAEENARIAADNNLQNNIDIVSGNLAQEITDRGDADTTLQNNINAEKLARQNADTALDTAKVDKTSLANKVYGTDDSGDQTTFDKSSLGNVDTVNNVQPDANKNVLIDATQINVDETAQTKVTIKSQLDNLNNNKVEKTSSANKVYGTDNNGDQTTFDTDSFGKVDTVNNVQPDNNKNVLIGTGDIASEDMDGVASTLAATISELQTIVGGLRFDLQTQIKAYTQDTAYMASGTYVTQKFVTVINGDGILIMGKVLRDFISDKQEATVFESFMKDVDLGNLQLVGGSGSSEPQEYRQSFEILNQIDGNQDEYSGIGGTEQEVEEIFDDILGNE